MNKHYETFPGINETVNGDMMQKRAQFPVNFVTKHKGQPRGGKMRRRRRQKASENANSVVTMQRARKNADEER